MGRTCINSEVRMKKLTDGSKILQPTSVERPGEWGGRFERSPETMRDILPPFHISNFFDGYMFSLGYTKNPATCHHDRKKMTDSTMRWRCMDCGTFVT